MGKKSKTAAIVASSNLAKAPPRQTESVIDQLLPGRHPCECQARRHALVRNCMGCGKIVCVQEGSGPCFECGTLVCTVEEREILDRGSKKSAELYNQLMGSSAKASGPLPSVASDLQKATNFRNRLLEADLDVTRRTQVNDLESDYSNIENNPFLSKEEREFIVRRREEVKRINEQRKKAIVINLNLGTGDITNQKQQELSVGNDPVIRSILDRCNARQECSEANANERVFDPHANFVAKYDASIGQKMVSNASQFSRLTKCSGEGSAELEVERMGFALALSQPFASCLANGKIRAIRWPVDVFVKGPLFICAKVGQVQMSKLDISKLNMNLSGGCIVGRAFLQDCLPLSEYKQEHGNVSDLYGVGEFVLLFSAFEPLVTPVPHIPPEDFYQLDEKLKTALAVVFC